MHCVASGLKVGHLRVVTGGRGRERQPLGCGPSAAGRRQGGCGRGSRRAVRRKERKTYASKSHRGSRRAVTRTRAREPRREAERGERGFERGASWQRSGGGAAQGQPRAPAGQARHHVREGGGRGRARASAAQPSARGGPQKPQRGGGASWQEPQPWPRGAWAPARGKGFSCRASAAAQGCVPPRSGAASWAARTGLAAW
jgi:hypothetical protein